MTLSRRQRREVRARQFLSLVCEPLSDGQWCAMLMEDGKCLYRSSSQHTPAEALPFAVYECDALVEKRVDAQEREDEASDGIEAKAMHSPQEAHGVWG